MRGGQPGQTSYGDWMPLSGSAAGAVPSPFTIISSNPTYMSYRDPAPSAAPFTSFMNSYSLSPSRDGSLQSFTPQQQAYQNFLAPEVMMTDFNLGSSSLDSANYTFASNGNENNNFGELYSTQPTGGEQAIASFGCDATTNNHSPANERSTTTERCPKEGIAQEIAKRGLSSFAPADGSDTIKERLGLAGQVLPPIAKSDSNIDAEEAYNKIRSHPRFRVRCFSPQMDHGLTSLQDLDINSLCQEFAQKARCDGTRVVLAPSGMQELVDSLHARTTKV
jgi:AP-1-like factor